MRLKAPAQTPSAPEAPPSPATAAANSSEKTFAQLLASCDQQELNYRIFFFFFYPFTHYDYMQFEKKGDMQIQMILHLK